MKKSIWKILAGIVLLNSLWSMSKGADRSVHEEVKTVITRFNEGVEKQSGEILKTVFHPESRQFFYFNGEPGNMDLSPYLNMIDSKAIGGQKRSIEFQSFTVENNLASVWAVFNDGDNLFIHQFSLQKISGE